MHGMRRPVLMVRKSYLIFFRYLEFSHLFLILSCYMYNLKTKSLFQVGN